MFVGIFLILGKIYKEKVAHSSIRILLHTNPPKCVTHCPCSLPIDSLVYNYCKLQMFAMGRSQSKFCDEWVGGV